MTKITLKTLPQATAQQVFNQVAAHLLEQNAQAKNADGCVYLTESGMQCAAGCLISAEEYNENLEHCDWRSLVLSQKVPGQHVDLIQDLQFVHDNRKIPDWMDRLHRVATKHGLEFYPFYSAEE